MVYHTQCTVQASKMCKVKQALYNMLPPLAGAGAAGPWDGLRSAWSTWGGGFE